MSEKKQPEAGTTPPAYQLAAVVARNVELANVYMRGMKARCVAPRALASDKLLRDEAEVRLEWKTSHTLQEVPPSLTVVVAYRVALLSKGEKPELLVEIEPELALEYTLAAPPPVEAREVLLNAFAQMNGVYNSWPYFREIVQNACSRMALPPVILPVYRVPKPVPAPAPVPEAK